MSISDSKPLCTQARHAGGHWTKWASSRLEACGRHGTEGKKKGRNEWRDLRHKAVQRSRPEPWMCVIDSRIRKISRLFPVLLCSGLSTPLPASARDDAHFGWAQAARTWLLAPFPPLSGTSLGFLRKICPKGAARSTLKGTIKVSTLFRTFLLRLAHASFIRPVGMTTISSRHRQRKMWPLAHSPPLLGASLGLRYS